jgi:hypothetical protein
MASTGSVLRHAALPWRAAVRPLRHSEAAALLDRLDPERAVAAPARQHDADGALPSRVGERAQEHVDRSVPLIRAARQEELFALNRHHMVSGTDVNMVGLDDRRVSGDPHRHRGMPAQNLRQGAFMAARHVRDEDECHARVGRHSSEQSLQRFHAAGGGTDADNGKRLGVHACTSRLRPP